MQVEEYSVRRFWPGTLTVFEVSKVDSDIWLNICAKAMNLKQQTPLCAIAQIPLRRLPGDFPETSPSEEGA